MQFPGKKSNKWFFASAVLFLINILAILYSRSLLGLNLDSKNIIAIIGIAFVISLITSLGFLGLKILPITVIVGNVIGIAYMYYIILGNRAQGWNDITSLIALLYFVAMGIAFGGLMEIIYKIMGGNIFMKKINK
jgi:hypothetical protein